MTEVPPEVVEWVREVFSECNVRVTDSLDRNPNAPEPTFDLSWIEHVGRYSSPTVFEDGWAAKIESHFLGQLRHIGNWEIADIGILVFLRLGPTERRSKVALLQSKRLYPDGTPVREQTMSDFQTGFARLADPEDESRSLLSASDFRFTEASEYRALVRGSPQISAISKYESENRLTVYYQLYNPWSIPFVQRIPLAGYTSPEGRPLLGVRLVPATTLHELLETRAVRTPKLQDIASLEGVPSYGWRLEDFISDELLLCRAGNRFEDIRDERIETLFYRRTGPIASAIAITIEAPGAVTAR